MAYKSSRVLVRPDCEVLSAKALARLSVSLSYLSTLWLQAELKEIVKRALQTIKQHGGLVGQLDNLGEQRLPYRMKKHGERFDRGL